MLVRACAENGIAAFTGDGVNPDVMTMATKAIGAADKVGTIETGKLADFVVTNADYTQKRVFIGGKEI